MASVTVDVDMDEFNDDEILEGAIDVIKSLSRRDGPLSPHIAGIVAKLRSALWGLNGGASEEEAVASPAARLATMEDLRALVAQNPKLYRFAEEA